MSMSSLRIGIDVGVSGLETICCQLHPSAVSSESISCPAHPSHCFFCFNLIILAPTNQGTATDAVLLSGQLLRPTVLAKIKVPTTTDVLSGVSAALHQLQQQLQQQTQQQQLGTNSPSTGGLHGVQGVFLGTTQFVNAVVQRKGLARVFVVRLCGTATKALPPFLGFPQGLQQAVAAGYLLVGGEV